MDISFVALHCCFPYFFEMESGPYSLGAVDAMTTRGFYLGAGVLILTQYPLQTEPCPFYMFLFYTFEMSVV